jgi:hypothetical protein
MNTEFVQNVFSPLPLDRCWGRAIIVVRDAPLSRFGEGLPVITRDDILAKALALPPVDQAYVADMLEQSMAIGHFSSPEIGEVWSNEINRRITAYDRGETLTVDFDKSLEHLKQAIAEYRNRQATP